MSPSEENFERIPKCLKPTPTQRSVPHPLWIDFILWYNFFINDRLEHRSSKHHRPDLRDAFIVHPEHLGAFEKFTPSFASFISANWPYSPANLVDVNSATDDLRLSSQFEQYIVDVNNWSLDSALVNMFPFLADKVRITSDEFDDAASS